MNEEGYQLFLFIKNDYNKGPWSELMAVVMNIAQEKNIKGFLVSNLAVDRLYELAQSLNGLTPLRCDATAIKTAARANPTLYLVRKGTIVNKWGFADFDQAGRYLKNL